MYSGTCNYSCDCLVHFKNFHDDNDDDDDDDNSALSAGVGRLQRFKAVFNPSSFDHRPLWQRRDIERRAGPSVCEI